MLVTADKHTARRNTVVVMAVNWKMLMTTAGADDDHIHVDGVGVCVTLTTVAPRRHPEVTMLVLVAATCFLQAATP